MRIFTIFLVWFLCPNSADISRPKFVDIVRQNLLIPLVRNIYNGNIETFSHRKLCIRFGIVQNLCEYCRFFFCDKLDPNCANAPKCANASNTETRGLNFKAMKTLFHVTCDAIYCKLKIFRLFSLWLRFYNVLFL